MDDMTQTVFAHIKVTQNPVLFRMLDDRINIEILIFLVEYLKTNFV